MPTRAGLLAMALVLSACGPVAALDTAAVAQRPGWQKLLHMEPAGPFRPARSAVQDPAFFLAEAGRHDPRAELEATLAAFRQPAHGAPGEHALCRFPGRAAWLRQKTGASWPSAPDCPGWESWRRAHAGAGQAGLVFVSGYMANPASFFGHIMLHLPSRGDGAGKGAGARPDAARELLATSASFGADIPDGHGLVTYMANGLTGGYAARFSHAPFYRNTALYSEHEMRSLWRYPLRLSAAEQQLLVAHLYELDGHAFDYRFLDENCASRLGRVLELVAGTERGRLVPRGGWFVEPGTIVRRTAGITRQGESLLAPPARLDSRRAVTERRFAALSGPERAAARAVWPRMGSFDLARPAYQHLPEDGQARVLDTLLSHLTYLKQKTDRDGLGAIERQLLQGRLAHKAGSAPLPATGATPIHEARPESRLQLDARAGPAGQAGLRLSLRPLKLDLLEGDAARLPGAALEAGKVSLELDRDGARLHRLDLVRVTNLNAQAVPLPGAARWSWSVHAAIAPAKLGCRACRDGWVRALGGKAGRRGRQTAFALLGGELRTTRHQAGAAAWVGELGLLSRWRDGRRSLLRLRHREAFAGPRGRQLTATALLRQRLGPRLDLRARLAGQARPRAVEATLGLAQYF